MYEKIYESYPKREQQKTLLEYPFTWRHHPQERGFRCSHCSTYVPIEPVYSGVQNRNHCPVCLWSRHMDWQKPGDRMSACKAGMQPIGLTEKHHRNKYGGYGSGELMLVHRCDGCGKLSINRIAADDWTDRLLEIYDGSLYIELPSLIELEANGIHLLRDEDRQMVTCQLVGCIQI